MYSTFKSELLHNSNLEISKLLQSLFLSYLFSGVAVHEVEFGSLLPEAFVIPENGCFACLHCFFAPVEAGLLVPGFRVDVSKCEASPQPIAQLAKQGLHDILEGKDRQCIEMVVLFIVG